MSNNSQEAKGIGQLPDGLKATLPKLEKVNKKIDDAVKEIGVQINVNQSIQQEYVRRISGEVTHILGGLNSASAEIMAKSAPLKSGVNKAIRKYFFISNVTERIKNSISIKINLPKGNTEKNTGDDAEDNNDPEKKEPSNCNCKDDKDNNWWELVKDITGLIADILSIIESIKNLRKPKLPTTNAGGSKRNKSKKSTPRNDKGKGRSSKLSKGKGKSSTGSGKSIKGNQPAKSGVKTVNPKSAPVPGGGKKGSFVAQTIKNISKAIPSPAKGIFNQLRSLVMPKVGASIFNAFSLGKQAISKVVGKDTGGLLTKGLELGKTLFQAASKSKALGIAGRVAMGALRVGRMATPLGWASLAAEGAIRLGYHAYQKYQESKGKENAKEKDDSSNVGKPTTDVYPQTVTPGMTAASGVGNTMNYNINSNPQFQINILPGTPEQQVNDIRQAALDGVKQGEKQLTATVTGGLS